MSIGVVAIPWFLSFIMPANEDGFLNEENLPNICNNSEKNNLVISEVNFIEKKFQTPFVDETILLKTLEEHGCTDIKNENNQISAKCQNYYFIFSQNDKMSPYDLVVKCLEKDNAETKMADLNTEYSLNAQEESYLNIIENLKNNNLELEQEEVLDDNTIVLTINLEN